MRSPGRRLRFIENSGSIPRWTFGRPDTWIGAEAPPEGCYAQPARRGTRSRRGSAPSRTAVDQRIAHARAPLSVSARRFPARPPQSGEARAAPASRDRPPQLATSVSSWPASSRAARRRGCPCASKWVAVVGDDALLRHDRARKRSGPFTGHTGTRVSAAASHPVSLPRGRLHTGVALTLALSRAVSRGTRTVSWAPRGRAPAVAHTMANAAARAVEVFRRMPR